MEKAKEYLKAFSYIFYPGIVFILYLTQVLEGKVGIDLIFCPTDIVMLFVILGIYMLLDSINFFEANVFSFMKKDDGRLKIPFLLVLLLIMSILMKLYDDLKVIFYLNNDVSINLIIVVLIGLVFAGITYIVDNKR